MNLIVPQFVDKWIKENNSASWWKVITKWEMKVPVEDREVFNWYTDCNEDNFIIAWITKVYEIEEETLYFVEFPNISSTVDYKSLLSINHNSKEFGIGLVSGVYVDNYLECYLFTEREIKEIDERYWSFAVPVEEEQ